jgi:excisionase family DNA binding protein
MPWGSVDRDAYMTRQEAADYLGIPIYKVKPLIDSGTLKGLQRGRFWYVERASAEALKKRGNW